LQQHANTTQVRRFGIAIVLTLLITATVADPASAAEATLRGAGQFTIPSWFKNSFLDLKEDAAEAGAAGKYVLLYIGQEGCPYCAALFNANFSQKEIVDYTRAHFDAIELNLWGDRPVTDVTGDVLTEKAYAAKHDVAFTPTILFFDRRGTEVLRINGYYPPRQFIAALRYVVEGRDSGEPFSVYLKRVASQHGQRGLHAEAIFEQAPYDLFARASAKPIAVFFEQSDCEGCDDLHRTVLADAATRKELKRLSAIQLDRWSATPVTTPEGVSSTAREWADRLNVAYVPTIVLFDRGREVIRIEAMFKSFHVQSAIDYVVSGAYRQEPSFQRFVRERSERLRQGGVAVDLWK
jgi:thioredoxin-related protein